MNNDEQAMENAVIAANDANWRHLSGPADCTPIAPPAAKPWG